MPTLLIHVTCSLVRLPYTVDAPAQYFTCIYMYNDIVILVACMYMCIIETAYPPRVRLEREAEELSHGGEAESDRLMDVYERLEELDASTAEPKAARILFGLGGWSTPHAHDLVYKNKNIFEKMSVYVGCFQRVLMLWLLLEPLESSR